MKTIQTLAALAVMTVPAMAGNLAEPVDPVIAAPVVADSNWSGAYAGLFAGVALDGKMYDIGGPYFLNNDAYFGGGFIGYRHDLGDLVVGAEVSTTALVNVYQAAFPAWKFTSLTDLRATLGYDMGDALVYVAGGYTTSAFQTPVKYTYDGFNVGAGIDYMVTDNFFLGGEVVYRNLSRTPAVVPAWTGTFTSVQVRAGYRF